MPDAKMTEVLEQYNKGLELYKAQQFQEAKACFEKALTVMPEDGPSKLYVERCDQLIANPPGPGWDGVFTMTSK